MDCDTKPQKRGSQGRQRAMHSPCHGGPPHLIRAMGRREKCAAGARQNNHAQAVASDPAQPMPSKSPSLQSGAGRAADWIVPEGEGLRSCAVSESVCVGTKQSVWMNGGCRLCTSSAERRLHRVRSDWLRWGVWPFR